MKLKKLLFVLVLTLLLVGNTVDVAKANGAPLPKCGEHVASYSADYNSPILSLEFTEPDYQNVIIETYDGWKMTFIVILYNNSATSAGVGVDPDNPTYRELNWPSEISWVRVYLEKECSEPEATRFTGRYVYTLFGNYPCNLLSTDESIPARFLNPAYTAPLCDFSGQAHNWNGDWVKNKEMEFDGYFYGGPYYDTRPADLP